MGGCNRETEARQCPEHSFDRAASRNMHLNLVAKYIGVLCIIFPSCLKKASCENIWQTENAFVLTFWNILKLMQSIHHDDDASISIK